MIELRFHRDLYRGESVDEAIKVFDRYGTLTRAEEPSHWVVRVEAGAAPRARRIADELANYALGLTIESSRGGDAKSAVDTDAGGGR